MYGGISYYRDDVSISMVEFLDKERNDNQMMKYSTTKFGKDENDDKLYKELTTLIPHG